MRFRVVSICEIPNSVMLEEGVNLTDYEDVQEVFWRLGGVSTWEDYTEDFEIL